MTVSRRTFVSGSAALVFSAPIAARGALAEDELYRLVPDADFDQTATLQLALERAADSSGRLFLPSGRYFTSTLNVPSGLMLTGVPGRTVLVHRGSEPLLSVTDGEHIVVAGLSLDGDGSDGEQWHGGLVHVVNSTEVTLRDCRAFNTALNAISFLGSSGSIENCVASDSQYTGIFVYDSAGLRISGNRVFDCGNGGIRVWRGSPGPDGTIVTENTISGIDWRDGGNGQNGNGINIFQADNVIVANNSISDCTFSAIRLNTTNNTHVSGNSCLNSGEVAIYSEFSFTGSVIADNIVDGASGGISITNFNDGGRLATCTGNIVRNLVSGSATNPDLEFPYGIAAEADAVISGNVVENVAGTGIVAGWGPYLRDVAISNNLIRDVETGIGVSVAPGAGAAIVSGNTISGARRNAIAGSAWWDVVAPDLPADAASYPQLSIGDNTVLT